MAEAIETLSHPRTDSSIPLLGSDADGHSGRLIGVGRQRSPDRSDDVVTVRVRLSEGEWSDAVAAKAAAAEV